MRRLPESFRAQVLGAGAWASRVSLGLLFFLVAFAAAGCHGERQGGGWLRLSSFRQASQTDVCLNEPLVLDFSEELDLASVTDGEGQLAGSLRITGEDGVVARGTFTLNPKQIVFHPRLPRARDLSDGGFHPGETYFVELVGFPRPDGIRAASGRLLEHTVVLSFRTASGEGDQPLFHPSAEVERRWPVMALASRELSSQEPLALECSDAIDPRSLHPGEFQLTPLAGSGNPSVAHDVIALTPRLVENVMRSPLLKGRGLARIELIPSRALALGRYLLMRPEKRALSVGGQSMEMPRIDRRPLEVVVTVGRVRQETIDLTGFSRLGADEAFGMDGTAVASSAGEGLTITMLAAAGDGSAGPAVPLLAAPETGDLHATRLEIPGGVVVDLSQHEGCVVLRAQGAMEIRGTLRRSLSPAARGGELRPFHASLDPAAWPTLSDWLERIQRWKEPWTVLIAGGELRIAGRIEVEGPLMLIAGGWIRVYAEGRVEAASIHKSPAGGDNLGLVKLAPLKLDPPVENLLVAPLRFAALTHPFRPANGVQAWNSASVQSHAGLGTIEVQYLGMRDTPVEGGPLRFIGPVQTIEELGDCPAVRLLLVIEVPAKGTVPSAWDPPRLESVDLRWQEPRRAGSRRGGR